jgi:hypothetical protein
MPDPESYVTDSTGGPPHDGMQPQVASGEQDPLDRIKAHAEAKSTFGPTDAADRVSLQEVFWLIGEVDIRRAWNASLHSQLAASQADVEHLRGLLRRLEWACACDDGEPAFCPACSVYRGRRHERDCWLAAALGRTTP